MGPFVPDLISDQLNLVVALAIGFLFGFVLEQAGFSSSRRLVGVFYGYDLTVLRVFFTAAVTAAAGVLLLAAGGLLDLTAIFVNPTWLAPAIAGGVLMGLGFLLGGFCPGTSVCAAAIGKVDAIVFLAGGALGVFGYAELFPASQPSPTRPPSAPRRSTSRSGSRPGSSSSSSPRRRSSPLRWGASSRGRSPPTRPRRGSSPRRSTSPPRRSSSPSPPSRPFCRTATPGSSRR